MGAQARVVWDDGLTGYDFGPSHPMHPLRLELTARLCEDLGLLDRPDVEVVSPGVADDDVLATVHDRAYIDAVRRASADPDDADPRRGLGTSDDPAFAGMHEASARIVAGSIDIAEAVWTGAVGHGVNFCGGMHHAMRERAAGFCIYNDASAAIRWLLDHGAERVGYIDVDVHHGDGVEQEFWDDPRVLTISLHESGHVLFPGTGAARDCGGEDACGYAVNVALPPGTRDAAWLRAFDAVVPPLIRGFAPDVLVSQQGCDTHATDPLAHLALSVDAQRTSYELIHDLAHEVCDGRWVALGGGGYAILDVVPRAWAHLTAIATHRPVPLSAPVPERWRAMVHRRFDHDAPLLMGDGAGGVERVGWTPWSTGWDPDDPVDISVRRTREAVFPQHGLSIDDD